MEYKALIDFMKLTTAQAIVKFLSQQFVERDQKEYKFINGILDKVLISKKEIHKK